MAQYYVAVGEYEAALASAESVDKGTAMDGFYTASIHAAAGRADDALGTLEESFDAGYRDFAGLDASPYFDALRDDPRYRELVQRYRD